MSGGATAHRGSDETTHNVLRQQATFAAFRAAPSDVCLRGQVDFRASHGKSSGGEEEEGCSWA
jgi:hypothetical protein